MPQRTDEKVKYAQALDMLFLITQYAETVLPQWCQTVEEILNWLLRKKCCHQALKVKSESSTS